MRGKKVQSGKCPSRIKAGRMAKIQLKIPYIPKLPILGAQ